MLSDGDVCPCCGLHAGEELELGAEVAAERQPVGLQWRKAKSTLNLLQHGTGKSDKSEYGKPPMHPHSTSMRDLSEYGKPPMHPHSTSMRDFHHARSDDNASDSQSLRDVSHEVRYRRPSTASKHSSSSEPANQSLRDVSHEVRYRRPSTASKHSSSAEPANQREDTKTLPRSKSVETMDGSSPLSYPQDPRRRRGSEPTLATGGSFRINAGRSSKDVLNQMRLETDKLKNKTSDDRSLSEILRSKWVTGQEERLSYQEASASERLAVAQSRPGTAKPVYEDIDPQRRGAPTPDRQSRPQTAKPVSLKEQIKEQFRIQALEWQPPNYIAPIVKDSLLMMKLEKAERGKVFRARNARK